MDYYFRYKTREEMDDLILKSDGEALTGCYFEREKEEITDVLLPVFRETSLWLDQYFSGEVPSFVPFYKIEKMTDFRKEVIDEMLNIPFGKTATYGEIAETIAKKHGIRKMSSQAVGNAVGWNPICIIIPCHRVVGTNGSLTGYGGGMKNKIALLENERVEMSRFSVPKKGNKL